MNWTKVISTLTAGLVLILALMAFALSYASLRHLAGANGVGLYLAYVWPLLLDFAMVVFSLAILRASLRGERAAYAWLLTLTFGAMATAANVFDVTTFGLPPVYVQVAVKALPPVALVLTFELLMSMVKADVRQAGIVQSLAELTVKLNVKRSEVDVQLSKIRDRFKAVIERERLAFQAERDHLTMEAERLRVETKRLRAQMERLAERQNSVQDDKLAEMNAKRTDDKQVAMNTLVEFYRSNPLASLSEAGQEIGRSKATVSNYLNELEEAGTVHRNGQGVEVLSR